MTQKAFHFFALSDEPGLWQVRKGGPAGKFVGTVAGRADGYLATHITPGDKLPTKSFTDRDAAALWLVKLAGG